MCLETRLTYSRASSCWAEGTLSERSSDEEDVHALDGAQPLQAGDGEQDGEQDHEADAQRQPAPQAAGSWTSLFQASQSTQASASGHRQQVNRMGEVEVHSAIQFLHAMILRIGHVKVSAGIERDAPGIGKTARLGAGAADDLDRVISGVKHLDPAVAELADILPAFGVHDNIVGVAQLADPRPALP